MLRLTSLGTFIIKERGRVFIVENPTESGNRHPKWLLGQEVMINTQRYRVKGVEAPCLPSDTHLPGEQIGLLVDSIA